MKPMPPPTNFTGEKKMDEKELQELRDWSAGLMEFYIVPIDAWADDDYFIPVKEDAYYKNGDYICKVKNWRPDADLNQAFMVVEKMRELGWRLRVDDYGIYFCVTFLLPSEQDKTYALKIGEARNSEFAVAILLAAKAAKENATAPSQHGQNNPSPHQNNDGIA